MKSIETYTHLESFPTSIGALKSFQQKLEHGKNGLPRSMGERDKDKYCNVFLFS